MSEDHQVIVQTILHVLHDIGDHKINVLKNECRSLTRRANLLVPFFEEIRDMKQPVPANEKNNVLECLEEVESALRSAKKLLNSVHKGSKLFLVLHGDKAQRKFQALTCRLEKALRNFPHGAFDIPIEYKEQVELLHTQLVRARGEVGSPDWELYRNIDYISSQKHWRNIDPIILKKCAEKLNLTTSAELKVESEALHRMVKDTRIGDRGEIVENISNILKIITAFVLYEYPQPREEEEEDDKEPNVSSVEDEEESSQDKEKPIPNEFRCPITLEPMEDPVIVATGQTYERTAIQEWLYKGHKTCPKTQSPLPHYQLIPNIAIRSLITEWYESNGIEVPTKQKPLHMSENSDESNNGEPLDDKAAIDALFWKLSSASIEEIREAAGELRVLANKSAENRLYMSSKGLVRSMVNLLCSYDQRTQEHAVTTLFNMAITESIRGEIAKEEGGIEHIIEVVKNGSMEARANGAGTLLSLITVTSPQDYRTKIAQHGGIPPLVKLLLEGDETGKKDAASVLFMICSHQSLKAQAINAGIADALMEHVKGDDVRMCESALAIMSLIATEEPGKVSIGGCGGIPVLVGLLRSGSPRAKENCVGILLELCSYSPSYLHDAMALDICSAVTPLLESDRERTKRRASSLYEHIQNYGVELEREREREREREYHNGRGQKRASPHRRQSPFRRAPSPFRWNNR